MGTLVGRDAELARLRGLLHDAAEGRAVTGLVSGDAGIGKSRLVAEAMQIAERDGFTVLCGQCAEIGDSVPYLPFADALRAAPARIEKAVKARPVLSRLLPDGDGQAEEGDWAGLARQQMFGAVLSLLSEIAAEGPVLLVIEDLHWADATTRHLVTFLSRMLHRERVAIIGTYRTDDLHRRHPLRAVIAELLRLPMVALVELGPLSAASLAEILFDVPNERTPLSAAAVNSLVERAEGNAYYAKELLTASSCSADTTGGTLPTGLAELLLSRVERVSDAAKRVLRAAAVAGGGAADDLVRAASGLSDDAYEEAVREAAGQQLLSPDGPAGFRFRHALLREAIYGDLMPGERTRLHAKLASLLATVFANSGRGVAAELAHHCMASHDIPGAFAASVRAGAEASRLGAPAEAHRHYDLALELWARVDEAPRIAGTSRGKLGLKSALAAAASGDVPRAVHLLRRIRDWVPEETEAAQDVELRSRVGRTPRVSPAAGRELAVVRRGTRRGEGDRGRDAGRAADVVPGSRHGDLRHRADGCAQLRRRQGLGQPRQAGGSHRWIGLRGGRRARHQRATRPADRQLRRGDRHVHRRDRAGGSGRGGRRPAARRLPACRRAAVTRRTRGGRERRPQRERVGGGGGPRPRTVRA